MCDYEYDYDYHVLIMIMITITCSDFSKNSHYTYHELWQYITEQVNTENCFINRRGVIFPFCLVRNSSFFRSILTPLDISTNLVRKKCYMGFKRVAPVGAENLSVIMIFYDYKA